MKYTLDPLDSQFINKYIKNKNNSEIHLWPCLPFFDVK